MPIGFLFSSGTGKPIEIYDGRQSFDQNNIESSSGSAEKLQTNQDPGKGEIIYFRDSDDEMPDSDEDPDDDLDIWHHHSASYCWKPQIQCRKTVYKHARFGQVYVNHGISRQTKHMTG